MVNSRCFYLALASLLSLVLAGSYVMGDDAWMSSLLLIPAILILRGLQESATGSASDEERQRDAGWRRRPRLRLGVALVVLSLPAAYLIDALGLNDLTMLIVAVPTMILVTLFDREYFGWTDPDDGGNPSPTA